MGHPSPLFDVAPVSLFTLESPRVCVALDLAHVCRNRGVRWFSALTVATLAVESARLASDHPCARYSAVRPVLGFLTFTVVCLHGAFPWQPTGGRTRRDLVDLHEPGMEHGLLSTNRCVVPRDLDEVSRHFRLSGGCASGGSRLRSPHQASSNTMMSMQVGGFSWSHRKRSRSVIPRCNSLRHRFLCRSGNRQSRISSPLPGRFSPWELSF